jgi:hypothetical protein
MPRAAHAQWSRIEEFHQVVSCLPFDVEDHLRCRNVSKHAAHIRMKRRLLTCDDRVLFSLNMHHNTAPILPCCFFLGDISLFRPEEHPCLVL